MKSYSIFIIGNLYILYTINQKNNNNPDPVKPGMTGKEKIQLFKTSIQKFVLIIILSLDTPSF